MKRLRGELELFLKDKIYMTILCLTAAGAYGFTVSHPAIGMDDTAVSLYFEEGLAPYMGRWGLFLIGRFLRIGDFVPWMTEGISVLILILSVTLWCVLWRRICAPKAAVPMGVYGLVGGIFISSPIISEVFVFYLHNGVCLGYGVVALALTALLSGLRKGISRGERVRGLGLSALLFLTALGFYESFALVYILGAVTLFALLRTLYGKKGEEADIDNRFLAWLVAGAAVVGTAMAARAAVVKAFEILFGLDRFSVYNMRYYHLFGDLLSDRSELVMVLKRFYVKYYVNAVTYLPITVLVSALFLLGAVSLYCGIRKRDPLLPLCFGALILFPVAMSLAEGLTTRYRSAQYVPMVCAFGVLAVFLLLYAGKAGKRLRALCAVLFGILLFNQCADMNQWFYLDWLKYQDAKEVMMQIAYDLQSGYDTSKPIVFCGGRPVPYSASSAAYVSYSSGKYRLVSALTDPFDVHLKEKFHNGPDGYVSPESPVISVLAWGVTAFDRTSWQLIRFWELHGIEGMRCETDPEKIAAAVKIREKEHMPGYPKQGYIREYEDHIIVNMAD